MWWIFDCSPQRGIQPPTADVNYGGYVLESPATDAEVLSAGSLAFTLEDGSEVDATQPYADSYPGYWSAVLPASSPFQLVVSGDGLYPALWAGTGPASDGGWFKWSLLGAQKEYMDPLFTELNPEGLSPDEGGIAVWGVPADPDSWDCASVQVGGKPALCVNVNDDGSLAPVSSGTFDWFFAFNLEPGDVTVDSGLGGSHTYEAQAGQVVMAFWFVGKP